jgi:hypothetical protein
LSRRFVICAMLIDQIGRDVEAAQAAERPV